MLQVVIIGAGLGGLACAVGCRQKGLEVVVLERVSEISSVSSVEIMIIRYIFLSSRD